MDFADQLKQFSKRVQSVYPGLETEEATKMSIIVPFFAMLGYDVFNPDEFIPEFTADVGIKKGEKVDSPRLHQIKTLENVAKCSIFKGFSLFFLRKIAS